MKEIKSDKVFEKKIRIYQINRLEELNDFYQKHKQEYKNNYQKEKEVLENEISQITERIEKVKQNTKNVDEFIERVKKYINSPVLTREMALELIEFITIDKFIKGNKEPRKTHIYYKLIDNINGMDFKCNKQKRDRL